MVVAQIDRDHGAVRRDEQDLLFHLPSQNSEVFFVKVRNIVQRRGEHENATEEEFRKE